MTRTRTLVVLLVGLLVLLTAAACGGNGDAEPQPEGDPVVTQEEEAAPAEAGAELETVEPGVLTVGSDIPFPPFEYREGDELTGFDVDLVEEIAARLNLQTSWVETDFETIFTQLAGGRFDVVASATTITEEREEQVDFTEPYFLAQQALSVNAELTPEIQSVEDIPSGTTVAVQRGTTGEAWARENLPEGVEVRSFAEAPDTYTALEAGNVVAVIFDEPSAVTEAAARPDLEVVETIDTGERYGFAVNPENDVLLEHVNRVLQDMFADGTYREIYDRYEDLPPGGSVVDGAES